MGRRADADVRASDLQQAPRRQEVRHFFHIGRVMPKPLLGMIVALSLCGCSLFPELYDLQAEYYSPGRVWRVDLPEFKRASVALGAWDCRTAWNTMWPLAKAGNADARHFLATSMNGQMDPPGVDWSSPQSMRSQHVLTLSAYAAMASLRPDQGDPDHKWIRRAIPSSLRQLALGAKGEQVAECYRSGSFRRCLDLAVSLGVVPTFEDYAEEVERAERETGRSASCVDPHGPTGLLFWLGR